MTTYTPAPSELDMLARLAEHITSRRSRGEGASTASRLHCALADAINAACERDIDSAMYRARAYFGAGWCWND